MNKRGYQGGYWPIIRCAALCGALVVASQGDWLSAEVTESKQVAWVLPNGRASFGAAVIDNWVYVYGGHTGRRHQYSVDDISGKFWRARLNEGGWEELPSGPKLQGLALVAHNGHLYRVGGLTAYNQPNENEQKESTSTVARYLPYEMRWEELTPLPEPRSSHDAIVLDGKLYVVGGWQLTQEMATTEQWHPNAYVADLSQDPIVWQTLPEPPFRRRALAVAAANGRIVAVGGMNDEESVTNDAHYFDVASGTWNQGPDFPAQSRMKAFGASAFGVGDHVYASAGEGILYRLSAAADRWEPTNFTLQQRRFFHRLIADGNDSLLFIGGAARRGMIDHIEMVQLDQVKVGEPISTEQPTETQADASSDASTSVWPGFRGHGDSHSDAKRLPLHWSPDENIAWSAQVPGYGQSSPVVWRNRVVVTSVDGPKKEHLIVSCFDMSTGDVYWRRRVSATQKIDNDDYHSKAAPTPCVDDNGVYVFFESGDLISLDHEGNNRWQRSLTGEYGNFLGNHGVGSSLAATDDTLILLIDHAGPGYLLCVDKATGNNRWKIEREKRVSWSSPIINTYDGRLQIVISSNGVAEAFDAKTGAAGSVMQLCQHPQLNHQLDISGGVLANECGGVISEFFKRRRAEKKAAKAAG